MRRFAITVAIVLCCAAQPVAAAAATGPDRFATTGQITRQDGVTCTPRERIDRLVAYIRTQQRPDGSFPSIGQSSTADAVYSLAAAGVNPSRVTSNGNSAIDFIYSQTGNLNSTGVAAKFLLALVVSGRSPVAPNGFDFRRAVAGAFDPATGLYSPEMTSNAYALIALRAARVPVPAQAVRAMAARQQADGGWPGEPLPSPSDTNTTAVAVVALRVHGVTGAPITRAISYFHTQQAADGGFVFTTAFGTESDTNSTALSIVGLLVGGARLADFQQGAADPVGRLLDLQNPSGAFRFSDSFPADNAFASFQAGPALAATQCRNRG